MEFHLFHSMPGSFEGQLTLSVQERSLTQPQLMPYVGVPMKHLSLLFCLMLLLFLTSGCETYSGKTAPVAKNGMLDLSDWNFEKDGPVDLKGEWEFYWD